MRAIRRFGEQLGRAAGQAGGAVTRGATAAAARVPWAEEGGEDDGEELPPLPAAAADPELAALDTAAQAQAVAHLAALDEGAQPADAAADSARLLAILAALQPAPPLPRQQPFAAGLAGLLERLQDESGDGELADRRVAWVLERVASRLTITVDDDGIEVVGLLRRRRVPWDRVDGIAVADRFDLLRDHVIGGGVERAVAAGPLPVPGLSWLLERVLLLLERLLPRSWRDGARDQGGVAIAAIGRRRRRDLELAGPLALVAFLSEGLTAVVLDEADRRGIPVTGA